MTGAADTPYQALGGDAGVRALADRFYDMMEMLPEFEALRRLHPPDLTASREKFYYFLSGWLGGPALYLERIGNPMLRRRHLPFPIDASMRDQWLMCMGRALDALSVEGTFRAQLERAFRQVAEHMQNQPDAAG